MGSPPPVQGYNHNVRYRNRIYHVQTEDSGVENPHVYTHLFQGGVIISSAKTDYKEQLDVDDLKTKVRKLMQGQHKLLMKKLRRGELDEKIVTLLGTLDPEETEAQSQSDASVPTGIATPDARKEEAAAVASPPAIAVKTEPEGLEAGAEDHVAADSPQPVVIIEKDGGALRKVSGDLSKSGEQPLSREVATELESLVDAEVGGVNADHEDVGGQEVVGAKASVDQPPDTKKINVEEADQREATEPELEGLSPAEIAEMDLGLPELPLSADTVRIPADAAAAAIAAFQAQQDASLLQAIDEIEGISEFEVESTEAGIGIGIVDELGELGELGELDQLGGFAEITKGPPRMANPTEQMDVPADMVAAEEEFHPQAQETGPQRPSTLYSMVRTGAIEKPLAGRAVRPSRRVKAADLIPPRVKVDESPGPLEAKGEASTLGRESPPAQKSAQKSAQKPAQKPAQKSAQKTDSPPRRDLPPVVAPELPVLPARRKTKLPPNASTLYRYVAPSTGSRQRKDTGAYAAAEATVSAGGALTADRTGRLSSRRGRRRTSGEYSVLAGKDAPRPTAAPEVQVVARGAVMVNGPISSDRPPPQAAAQATPQTGPVAPARSKAQSVPDMFGSDLISERSLDEVILGYLSEEAENPEKK